MNVFVFGDPHLNMYSWAQETRADWDQDIAMKQHLGAMLDMNERAPNADLGILATMGDLFHSDSLKDATASGTPVDVDGRLGLALYNGAIIDRQSTRLNSSHTVISYAVFCLKKKKKQKLSTVG